MGGSEPDMPMLEEFQDTPWITRNRELNEQVYPYLQNAYQNLGSFDQDYMRSLADDYSAAQWSDLNRQYQQRVNQNLARNYNRLGTTGGSSSGYSDESWQRYYNDLASRVAGNTAQYYDQLVGNNLQRQLSQLGAYSDLFNTSGNITYGHDTTNQNVRWTNQDRAWQNDVKDYQAKGDMISKIGNTLTNAAQGATIGLMTGGPVGAVIGGVGGAATGYFGSGNKSGDTWGSIGGNIGKMLNKGGGASGTTGNLGSNVGGGFNPSFSGYTPLFGG